MRHGEDHHLLLQIVKLREELANVEIIARAAIEAAQNPSNPKEAFPPGGDYPGLLVIYDNALESPGTRSGGAFYKFLEVNDFGKTHALYYAAYALHMEFKGKEKTANEIFNLGIFRNAKPEPKENDLPSRSSGTILSRGDNNNNTGRQALGPQAKRTKLNQYLWLSARTLHRIREEQRDQYFTWKMGGIQAASASSFEVFVDEEECTDEGVEKKKNETISTSSSNVLHLNDGREQRRRRVKPSQGRVHIQAKHTRITYFVVGIMYGS
ncbi:Mitotic spindle checkpoint protein BUBR1 [Raphanus sativus]|nr:Mitotic spindle checkpoint protein BUBR1 [Raphanus sativus]